MPVRLALPADAEAIADLAGQLWPDEPYDPGNETVFVWAGEDGTLGGFVAVALRPWVDGAQSAPCPHVEGWFVAPQLRRRGIGRALIAAVEAWCRRRGFAELTSDVLTDNATSLAAHAALGFAPSERIQYFRKPLPPATGAAPSGRWIDVGDGHAVFVREVGAPDAPAAVFLHGGPGSGCTAEHESFFDPSRWRLVLPDQRGAGESRFAERFAANTTAHLVGDLERIRAALGIQRWLVVGGSWGATLAIAYAEAHPERVSGLVLRAVFLGGRAELDWAFVDGPRRFRPELFAEFLGFLPEGERGDPLNAYWRRLRDADPAVHAGAALAWHRYERTLSRLVPPPLAVPTRIPLTPRMEAHYFAHDCFLAPGALLAGAKRLAAIPGIVVQARYDLLCPPAGAFALAAAWGNADLRFVEGAGHSAADAENARALGAAIAEMAGRV